MGDGWVVSGQFIFYRIFRFYQLDKAPYVCLEFYHEVLGILLLFFPMVCTITMAFEFSIQWCAQLEGQKGTDPPVQSPPLFPICLFYYCVMDADGRPNIILYVVFDDKSKYIILNKQLNLFLEESQLTQLQLWGEKLYQEESHPLKQYDQPWWMDVGLFFPWGIALFCQISIKSFNPSKYNSSPRS